MHVPLWISATGLLLMTCVSTNDVSLFLNSTFGEGSGLRRSRRGKRRKEARPTAAGFLRRPDVWVCGLPVRSLPARFNVLASPT